MKKILLLGAARQKSSRVPNKMLRAFSDTSLFDLFIEKFVEINEKKNPFTRVVLAVCKNDDVLWKKAKDSGLEIAERSEKSVSYGTEGVKEVHSYLQNYDEEFICNINACFPFLTVDTIMKFGEFFQNNEENLRSTACVKYRFNHFWDAKTHKPIGNKDNTCLSTKLVPPIFEKVCHMDIYTRKFMLENNAYYDYTEGNPYLYVVDESIENLDIDTMLDFEICEALYLYGGKKNVH